MKKFLYASIIFFIILNIATIAYAQCKESEKMANQLISMGLVMKVKNGYREWFISKQWYGLPLQAKEQAVQIFSSTRNKCDKHNYIKVFDGYSGKKIAQFGFSGVKIF